MQTVSALITTYNYGQYLAGAIESVLGQTLRPDEIIVVDDGSTDDTAAIVARYADRSVRYIYKENGGIASARNVGIRESTGALIAFLDADDRWLREKTALQVEHFRRHPQVGLVTGSEWQVWEDKGTKPWLLKRKAVGAAYIYPQILVENLVGTSSLTMIRRECFKKVGPLDERVGLGQDWDMWIRIAKSFPVGVIERPLIHYAHHKGSMSDISVWKRYKSNRVFHHRYIREVQPPSTRLRVLLSAQSMNLYYTGASLADDPRKRGLTVVLALLALLFNPLYKTSLKLGLLLKAAFGQTPLSHMRLVRRFLARRRNIVHDIT